jgi:hypothetical protein
MEIKINDNEVNLLRKVLNNSAVKARTGEIGIMHGADRFVSSNTILKKEEIEHYDKLLNKIGLSGIKKI